MAGVSGRKSVTGRRGGVRLIYPLRIYTLSARDARGADGYHAARRPRRTRRHEDAKNTTILSNGNSVPPLDLSMVSPTARVRAAFIVTLHGPNVHPVILSSLHL